VAFTIKSFLLYMPLLHCLLYQRFMGNYFRFEYFQEGRKECGVQAS